MYKEKLRELLKTVPDIKNDLENIKFWTEVLLFWAKKRKIIEEYPNVNKIYVTRYNFTSSFSQEEYKIIWNPLSEHHLRMYCQDKKINIDIVWNGSVLMWGFELICITELDNKDFDNQSEEVYEKIFNYVNKERWVSDKH